MKSLAVVNFAPEKGSVELREILKPEIGEEDVLLEVANVGVCGSDLHQWTADHSWPVNYPVVLGHEFGGHIVEIGKRVEKWKEGDRVVSETAAVINPSNPLSRQEITLPSGISELAPMRQSRPITARFNTTALMPMSDPSFTVQPCNITMWPTLTPFSSVSATPSSVCNTEPS